MTKQQKIEAAKQRIAELERLIKKGLIELIEDDNSNKSYRAVLARGEGAYLVPLEES